MGSPHSAVFFAEEGKYKGRYFGVSFNSRTKKELYDLAKLPEIEKPNRITAVFTTNNAYDSILVVHGSVFQVTPEIFKNFINPDVNFGYWDSPEDWRDAHDDIKIAAKDYGDIVAYNQRGKFVVVDQDRWNERREFYLGN